jgi:molybdopterin synthase catalytic subunit
MQRSSAAAGRRMLGARVAPQSGGLERRLASAPSMSRTMVSCWRRPTIRGLDWPMTFCLLPPPTNGRSARDHSPGREGVEVLEYEAYDEQVVPRLGAIAADARIRWTTVRRIALIHRTGVVPVGESAVIAVVSAPHRDEAFAAARFCIDALKSTVPIWKREEWSGGVSWGLEPQHITEVDRLGGRRHE